MPLQIMEQNLNIEILGFHSMYSILNIYELRGGGGTNFYKLPYKILESNMVFIKKGQLCSS